MCVVVETDLKKAGAGPRGCLVGVPAGEGSVSARYAGGSLGKCAPNLLRLAACQVPDARPACLVIRDPASHAVV